MTSGATNDTGCLPLPYPKGYYGTPSPRCAHCNGIVYVSNCTCSVCGRVTIVPEDGKSCDWKSE